MAPLIACLFLLLPITATATTPYPASTPAAVPGLAYTLDLYPDGADHDPAVPTPEATLGHPVGARAASSRQIHAYAVALAHASPRVELVEYARSFEGRPLVYLVISSPENLARREEIQAGKARLADPRGLASGERDRLIDALPAVAWLAYGIHGNESSSSDAAMAVMHHLATDRSQATTTMLRELVVIVDPNQNPDGRERFIASVAQARGTQPNVDDQSLVHTGYWPFGRGNHYLFDLNRDWIYARHPETRGRMPEIARWRPLMFLDSHEMGAQDTFLFSPAREPHNPNLPPYRGPLGEIFADDMARAFDRYGYPYYSGEWHEDWYPGYTDAWAALRGAQGILHEQARLAEDGVQRGATLVSYRQSVHHQVLASFANLGTLQRERVSMLRQFTADRAEVLSARGPYANRSFVILPGDNAGRMAEFQDLLRMQGFEAHRLSRVQRVARATDQLGRVRRDVALPEGSIVLRNRQPEARLLAAMFEFDPRMSESTLAEERRRLLAEGRSTIYDTTGWNISMMFGLEAFEVPEYLDAGLERLTLDDDRPAAAAPRGNDAIALVASGADDRTVALAARLMQDGLRVRANTHPSQLAGQALPIGSIAVTRDDNRADDAWQRKVIELAGTLGVRVHAVEHGRAPGMLADLGGQRWRLLERPSIALLGRGGSNGLDFGAVWYTLDHRLGLRHSHLDEERAAGMDLRRYNVIYLPDRWGGDSGGFDARLLAALADWVKAGGTLVAAGGAARALLEAEAPMVETRLLEQVLEDDLAPWQDAIHREWLAAAQVVPDSQTTWGHAAGAAPAYPWLASGTTLPEADERKRRDAWQRLFMPSGALVATRVDRRHWLTAGAGEQLTVLFGRSPVLMARPPVEAPLRVGVFSASESAPGVVNWSPVPEGQELRVRAAGLLWPEARERIASAAWVTREPVGRGQVILFAHPPAFRAAQVGAMRVLENALVLGPGLGASAPVQLP
jgi:hypothetical protein